MSFKLPNGTSTSFQQKMLITHGNKNGFFLMDSSKWQKSCIFASKKTNTMKKVVRTVWIGALSGLAFLAACCSSKGLSKAERKQLVRERDSIQDILARREGAAVYGSPEIIAKYTLSTYRLQNQLDSINYKLGEEVDLEKSARRLALQERIAELQAVLQHREGACVYGSPEVMERYGEETRRMKEELKDLRNQMKELNE